MPLSTMKETLLTLREYAIKQQIKASLSLHLERSHLVRLANGGISLNTSETVSTLVVQAYADDRTATASLVCGMNDLEGMKIAVDRAGEMLRFSSPLTFRPTFPEILKSHEYTAAYDPELAHISNENILDYINAAAGELEDRDVTLGGSFSVGETARCFLSTATEHPVCWLLSDAQVTLVLASAKDKWEINAEQSAEKLADLDAKAMNRRLTYLKDQYTHREALRLPLGPMRVVFGAAATAEYLNFLGWYGLSGSGMKRGNSIHREEDIGKAAFSPLVTVWEGPGIPGAFSLPADDFGRTRRKTAWYDRGVLKGFIWDQASADEFGQTATGHDVAHDSLELGTGDMAINSLEALEAMPRDCDILYVPYLHYTGVVSPSEGLITGTSRFGALLLKKDGGIAVPYNVRFTEKLEDIFGGKLQWLSTESQAYNVSDTYGSRNPQALVVPKLMCCEGVKVEISNKSY